MRLYEGLIILDSSLSTQGLKDAIGKVEQLVKKANGTVEKINEIGKKALGSPVRKKTGGMVNYVYFKMDPEKIINVNSELKLIPEILRFSLYRAERIPANETQQPKDRAVAGAGV